MPRTWLIFPLLLLYLWNLGGTGFLGPDEPRYASIGREMAHSHDLITPKLDGKAWYEKPPLLYWMIAAGRALRLPDEWAARLPVALLSVAFLYFFLITLEREFSMRLAIAATSMLATSAGWLAFSFAAVTDLPMSALFWAALMIAMYDTRRDHGYTAGALLGLSVLAKGLVPLVLFFPVVLIARGKRLTMLAGCIAVSAPWYIAAYFKDGRGALEELIWKHHFERFFSPALQHVQPFWYYAPILLAGIFPWTPLAGLLLRAKTYDDVRVRFLVAWMIYAFAFFSISTNKLPGYVLPLMPALAITFAAGLEKLGSKASWWLGLSVAMLVILPGLVAMLPAALLSGIRRTHFVLAPGIPFLAAAVIVWWLAWRERTNLAMLLAALTVVIGMFWVKSRAAGELDARVSVRPFVRAHQDDVDSACVDPRVRRDWQYGLNYYAGHALPLCADNSGIRIIQGAQSLTVEGSAAVR